ncbi:MAG: hypothetical protein RML35_02120 [Chloroherpetonaceae bacterium]|nr:hypothetical protein [Chloroherpetonaceae bacterium]
MARQPNSEGYYEMFLLPSFPISDFLMQESIAPVYELSTAGDIQKGFRIERPALVKKSELGWVLTAKGKIVMPA